MLNSTIIDENALYDHLAHLMRIFKRILQAV